MKHITNNIIPVTLLFILLTMNVTPVAFAQTGTEGKAQNFCQRIPAVSAKTLDQIAKTKAKITTRGTNKNTNLTEKIRKRDAAIASARAQRDTKLNERYTNLRGKATTETQKQAVETFVTTVQTDLTAKRSAVDAARNTYRTGVTQAINNRFPAIETALITYENSVKAAAESATNDCANNVAPNIARTAYRQKVQSAHTAFRQSVRNAANIRQTTQTLNQTRKQSIDNARNTFRLALQAASFTLKNILKGAVGTD